jgi:SAM-dependent methyltransferase
MSGVPIVNTEQADAWNKDEGRHWADHQDRYDALNFEFTERLLNAAAITETDAVLDIGCGNGQTTRLAARRASRGRAVGFDLSAPMLERAAATAADEGVTNVSFEQGDAQVHLFSPGAFDVTISRYGVMFFADPVAAFTNIGAALRSDGRLAFLCWQDLARNEWLMASAGAALQYVQMPDLGVPGAPGPFAFAEPERVQEILDKAGFKNVELDSVEAPMRLGDNAEDAVAFLRGTGVGRALLDNADDASAARALDAVTDALRPHEKSNGVYLNGAAWLVVGSRP